ncbi:MAG: LPS O-antigen subunit length determinant protein (WzzB/FepE family) [Psychroserpens sp.]
MENYQENISINSILWKGKWKVAGITVFFAVLSIILSLNLTNIYQANAILAPVSDDGGAGAGLAGLSQLGGLASLAGMDIGGVKTDKTLLAIEYLRSRTFLIDFINKHQVKVPLFAAKSWDPLTREMKLDPDIYDEKNNKWLRTVDAPRQPEPSGWESYEMFLELLTVDRDSKSGLVTLSVEHVSPELAYRWTRLLIDDLNDFMRTKDTLEANNSISFLEQQITQISVAGIQKVIYGLIEEQLKTKMLAQVREEYVFSYVDPPVIPEQKIKPRRAVICIIGTFAGGLFGCITVIYAGLFRARKKHS